MKRNRDQTSEPSGPNRRSLIGGALAAALAVLLARLGRRAGEPHRRSSTRSRWIGHY